MNRNLTTTLLVSGVLGAALAMAAAVGAVVLLPGGYSSAESNDLVVVETDPGLGFGADLAPTMAVAAFAPADAPSAADQQPAAATSVAIPSKEASAAPRIDDSPAVASAPAATSASENATPDLAEIGQAVLTSVAQNASAAVRDPGSLIAAQLPLLTGE